MILKTDLKILYYWAKEINFSTKNILLGSSKYWNKNVWMYPVKISKGKLRTSIMTEEVSQILSNTDIITAFFILIQPHSIALPHVDPKIYKERTKRIQIPLSVPSGKETFMKYKDEKIYWEEGIPQIADVMTNVHEAQNLTDFPLKFLMLDVKFESVIE